MEMNNSLAPAQAQRNKNDLVTYESNGEQVSLSISRIKKYLVSGGGQISDDDALMFLSLCRYQHLNPFLREAYLIKYGNNGSATIVTGKDVFLKRAQKHTDYDGLQAGIIVMTEDGRITEREGTFYTESETLVGGWCKVYLKGRRIPSYESVSLKEYIGRKKDGSVNDQWSKRPATMIRKVALVHALKEAFPEDLGALYAQEEIPEAQEIVLDDAPVRMDPEPEVMTVHSFGEPDRYYTAEAAQPTYEQAAFFPQDQGPAHGGAVNDPAAALFS